MNLLEAMCGGATYPAAPFDPAVTAAALASTPRAIRREARPIRAPRDGHAAPAVLLDGVAPLRGARFVAIAGNIGAGKSTLTAYLASRFGIRPFYEPNDNNPYLADFYADMPRWAFHSQMYFLSAKFRAHLDLGRLLAAQPHTVFVQDRTIYEDAEIFARTLHARGHLPARDFATYDTMYRAIRDVLPRPDLLIYLRCSVKGLRRRICVRGRPDEQSMDPAYLKALQGAYDDWIARYDLGPTLTIETERLDYLGDLCHRIDLDQRLADLLPTVGAAPTRC